MQLAFILSMPGRASWNGRWSGEDRLFARVRTFRKGAPNTGVYSYRWSDGWCASVEVREVDRNEARRLSRRSDGFCGYDWMISSIVRHGEILGPDERKRREQAATEVG